jgi:hypothetical protein
MSTATEATVARSRKPKPLTADLQTVVDSERLEFDRETKQSIRFHWNRGRVADAVKRNKSLDGSKSVNYGKNPVEDLADALGEDRSTVYRRICFFSMYPRVTDIERLAERIAAAKSRIGWSHIAVCVGAAPSAKGDDVHANRRKLIEDTIENGWTVRELQAETERRFMSVRTSDSRTGPRVILKKLSRIALRMNAQYFDSASQAIDAINALPSDDVDDRLLTILDEDIQALNSLADEASQIASRCTATYEKHKKALGRSGREKESSDSE